MCSSDLGAAVLDAAPAPGPAPAYIGKWKPITDITDPHVQALGGWTTWKHTWVYNDGLRFSKVVSGQMQIIAGGENYRLDVDALQLSGKDAMYKALVFEQDMSTTTTRKLVSFERAN